MESLIDKIKNDLKKGIDGGIAALKEGANVVSVKMNELTDEGKRQYKIFNLNLKIQDLIKELGGMVYAVLDNGKSVDGDKKIKATCAKIKKLEWQITRLEGRKTAVPAQKPAAKARPKKNPTKPVKKTAGKSSNTSAVKKQ